MTALRWLGCFGRWKPLEDKEPRDCPLRCVLGEVERYSFGSKGSVWWAPEAELEPAPEAEGRLFRANGMDARRFVAERISEAEEPVGLRARLSCQLFVHNRAAAYSLVKIQALSATWSPHKPRP